MNKPKLSKILIILAFLAIGFKIFQNLVTVKLISSWFTDAVIFFLILVILALNLSTQDKPKKQKQKKTNTCSKCGADIDKSDLFCPECGKKLK